MSSTTTSTINNDTMDKSKETNPKKTIPYSEYYSAWNRIHFLQEQSLLTGEEFSKLLNLMSEVQSSEMIDRPVFMKT